MKKFINIAESIADLKVYSCYRMVRLDIQFNKNDQQFHAFLELEASGHEQIEIEILPNGSFIEL